MILDHERGHILRCHHWDILFLSILLIFFPFHPLIYWYRKEIKLVHEFQVDASILKTYSEKEYASLLFQISHFSSLKFSMIHSLISSPFNPLYSIDFLLQAKMPANPSTSSNFYPHHGGDHESPLRAPSLRCLLRHLL